MIEAAKKEGLDYALMVKKSHDSQLLMSSIQVYKVYVEDGREEFAPNALLAGDQMSERSFERSLLHRMKRWLEILYDQRLCVCCCSTGDNNGRDGVRRR
ncbi:MAG: hypothetical protein WDO15_16215 [Bacteroidota bacterium]